jgi:hypothetical protein
MSAPAIIESINASGVAEWMRLSVKAMPLVEATHVLAIAVVFGSILIVDLRLLGLPGTQRPVSRIAGEMLRMTWAAFVLAVVTGALMFAPNALTYYDNTAFRFKMLALLAAGINMAVFQFITARSMAQWDVNRRTPTAARTAAIISMLLWITIILLGRWIGFTKGYDFSVPEDIQFEFPQ